VPYSGPIVTRADARSLELKHYFTGRPCKNGHLVERFVSNGACFGCLAMWADVAPREATTKRRRAWYSKNSDKIAERRSAIYHLNPEKYRARSRQNYWADPEKYRKRVIEWNAANPERLSEKNAAYYEANAVAMRARSQAWFYANKEHASVQRARRRALLNAAQGSHTAQELRDLFAKQKGKCAYCFKSIKSGYHADHIRPIARGGSNWITNIALACPTCNLRKNAKDPIRWALENGRLL
jgi:5-methylcytosine-specific restriction endonuclease McrA